MSTTRTLRVSGTTYRIHPLAAVAKAPASLDRLPFSLRVLLENLVRHEDGRVVRREHVDAVLGWDPKAVPDREIAFHPARVLLQDFTGVPAVVDLAAMREALVALGGDADRINPLSPADLVIDHSVQVDRFATLSAFGHNAALEMDRNRERYALLRWGQQAFRSFRVVPPDTGICHQVNLEHLASGVMVDGDLAFPDTLVGTDSHTTMINGLGVVGWGVGGIEAEAALLGQPLSMLVPQVVGFKLKGALPEGATATDLVLTVTQMLRKKKVVGKFVEFFGPGVAALALPDRATLANMAPEYGATIGFFPIDDETLAYLRFTGRSSAQVALVEAYCREQRLFRTDATPDPEFSDVVELDLGNVVPSMAGPKRPQDRIALRDMKTAFRGAFAESARKRVTVGHAGSTFELGDGSVVIAAITSCTNTSNPAVLMAAGLVAKKAVERGLSSRPWVKTSLAPGSKVVTEYLREAGLTPYLEALGFHLVGYGCTTCIGNSGPLPERIADAIKQNDLSAAAVLSGNRNFEGRIHPQVRLNYLASPPLVVAYALAGTVDVDLGAEPVGFDRNGDAVYLRELWPTSAEVREAIARSVEPEQFRKQYAAAFAGDERWRALPVPEGRTYVWQESSTYVRRPPFFDDLSKTPAPLADIEGARVLALLGDSVTTDHISPAGNIAKTSPAARYLVEHGVAPADFNSYGSRRGNHEVMVRGTFANIRLRNLLVAAEGGLTRHLPSGEELSIYDASVRYQADGVPLVVIAGAEYGTGSSRDWAAKGTKLLGVKAVIAKSFERIHRSNLVGMGVLPLELDPGEDARTLGLTGHETFDITGIAEGLRPGKRLTVKATKDGTTGTFEVTARVDTPNEVDYFAHGGILQFVLRQMAKAGA
jgi:aconitate hydratase